MFSAFPAVSARRRFVLALVSAAAPILAVTSISATSSVSLVRSPVCVRVGIKERF